MLAPIDSVPSDMSVGRREGAGQRLVRRWFAPVNGAPLVYFRAAFGFIMLWEAGRHFAYGWIARDYILPKYHFTYPGFDWVHPWPGVGMYLHFYLLAALAILIFFGLFYRLSALLFFLGFSYVFLLDQTLYLNHFYLVCLISFLMIFVPANCALSVDALRRPALRSSAVPAWAVGLLRFQVAVPYVYGGIAKLNPDWLHAAPMTQWLAQRTDFPLIGPLFTQAWMPYLFSYGGLLFDLLIVPGLLWRRTRTPALIVATLFHLTNARLFSIGIFPWLMIAATWILFAPDWLTRTRLWRLGGPPDAASHRPARRLIPALLGLYVLWQILMPLRHWLYPGYVSWTEEGHNFSWHMKLRGKEGDFHLYIFDPATFRTEAVDLSEYLTVRQVDSMSTRPHLILQFAHDLADRLRAQRRTGFSIHARALVSLNGRAAQLIIDPTVDLASQPRDFLHKAWVLPLETPLVSDRESSGSAHLNASADE